MPRRIQEPQESSRMQRSESHTNRLMSWLGAVPESPSSPSTLGAPSPCSSIAGDLQGSPSSYPSFDPVVHLRYRQGHLSKDVRLRSFGIQESEMDIAGEGALPLFTKQCCDIMRREIINAQRVLETKRKRKVSSLRYLSHGKVYNGKSVRSKESNHCEEKTDQRFYSPTLSECADVAPFCYSALTHPDSVAAVSAIAGQDLQVCPDLEIVHIASHKLDPLAHHRYSSTVASTLSSKSVAYPFICVVRLSGDDSCFELPPVGWSAVLQGRLTENIARNQLKSLKVFQDTPPHQHFYNVVLTVTFQPRDIIKFEDALCYKDTEIPNDEADDYRNVEKYVSWLKKYYEGQDEPHVRNHPTSPALSTSSI